jgi:hypothetical protein
MTLPVRTLVRLLLPLVVGTALAGCAGGGRPGDVGYAFNVSGDYFGRVHLEGEPFDATVSLSTVRRGAVSGTFKVSVPVLIVGQVEGVIVDDLLRIRITYLSPGGCDGVIEGILTVTRGGSPVEGPVTIRDCGEPVAGRLALRRAQPVPSQSAFGAPPSLADRYSASMTRMFAPASDGV